MLAKLAAIYLGDPDASSDAGTVAESSAWAASRKIPPKTTTCGACGDTFEFYKVARVPCGHEYCRRGLADLFRLAMTDETLFPPR